MPKLTIRKFSKSFTANDLIPYLQFRSRIRISKQESRKNRGSKLYKYIQIYKCKSKLESTSVNLIECVCLIPI